MKHSLIFSCEHAGKIVPREYQKLFATRKWLLDTHRGYDPGAFEIADILAKHFKKNLFKNMNTRLLVDVNRTLEQETLFSVVTKPLSEIEKRKILNSYYQPYRDFLFEKIKSEAMRRQVFHVSIHSFTPVMRGQKRACDIGLLFKKSDLRAKKNAIKIKKALNLTIPKLRVRMNYPYDAESGGIMNSIKHDLPKAIQSKYSGLFIEVNQKIAKRYGATVAEHLIQALEQI